MQRSPLFCILAACLLLISPAAASYTNEMNEWIDTGGQGRYWSWGATSGTTPVDVLHFSDITRASTLNYVALDVPSAVGSWSEGSHPMSYTIGGETRDGVFYVSYSRNALGSITGTRFILFFYDWNIGSLMGAQDVQITPILYNASRLYYSNMYEEDGDHYVRFQGSTGGKIHTGGMKVNNFYSGPRHTVTVSSGIDWANRITISDSYGGSDLNVALQREYGTKAYSSTLDIRSPTGSLYSSFGTTDVSLLYPADNVVMINVTSPSGQIYSYPQSLYTPEEPEYSPTLYGEVIDVYTGDPISGATITATQGAISRTLSTTSDASGKYTISPGPVAGYPITISASASGYQSTALSFAEVPRYSSWYVPLLMVPTTAPGIPTDPEKSMLYGYVITQGSQQPIQGASVTLSGVGSTTTSSTGFFVFNNITADTYTISASAPYHTPLSESVTVGATATQHNLALEGTHSLTVTVKDASDLTLVPGTTITLSDSQVATSQNPATFEVDYGSYTISVAAEGYYPASQMVYVERVGATSATVLMSSITPTPTPPEMPNYPPHNVKFTVQTLLGTPIPGVNVTAQGIQQTPSTNIIERLLGINMTSTPINTELMSGTTDSNGEINFMMVEAVKYRISLYKPDVVNQTLEIYPKEDTYPIIISTAGGPLLPDAGDALRDIRINVTTSTEGDTGHIHIDYNDTTRKTTGLSIQVTQQNTTNTSAPEDVIASHTVANDANVTHTFDLSDYKGQSFFVRLEAEHPDFGTINRDYAVAFKGVRVPLGPLPDGLYIYVAGFGLMLLGGIFGATSATRGVVVIALAGWLFYAFGWLDDLGLIAPVSLGLVSTLAVMGVIVTRYREEGYQ